MKKFLYFVGIMLVIATTSMPYGYYRFLKIVSIIAFMVIGYREFNKSGWNKWVTITIIGIVLMNPIYPIKMTKVLWQIIDPIMALVIFIYAYYLPSCKYKKNDIIKK